ncbi:hypothetical protein J6S37_01930 [Candidatus Saccharibacteria bacterium]|nr:hypothetical protein [Candidatus Saccharibacteria bacterium]
MKKLSTFLLLTLIFGLTISPGVNAIYTDDDGATWYTVEELLDYQQEIDTELSEVCADDIGCRQDAYFSKMETKLELLALEQLAGQQFILTAINPEQEYIKTLFFGEDMMLKRMGISEELDINQVYIGWLEDDVERIYRDGMDPDQYSNGEIPDAHTIYAWKDGTEAEQLIQPDMEAELPAANLGTNTTGQLIYNIDSGPGKFAAYGRFFYSECMTASNYLPGSECKLMTSAEKGQRYTPLLETVPNSGAFGGSDDNNDDDGGLFTTVAFGSTNPSDDPDPEEEITENGPEERTTEIAVASTNEGNISASEGTTRDEKIAEQAKASLTVSPKAPNTGTNTEACNQKTIEFPWWLAAMIAVGDVVVMWLFWPNNRKNRQKKY